MQPGLDPIEKHEQPVTPTPSGQLSEPIVAQPSSHLVRNVILVIAGILVLTGIVITVILLIQNQNKSDDGPAKTDTESSRQSSSETTKTDEPAVPGCLTAREAADTGYESFDFHPNGYIYGLTLFFEADTMQFKSDFTKIQNGELDKLAAWIKKYSDKKFTVEITGKINDTSINEGNKQLADQRAQYVVDQLVSRGVDKAKLVIKAPEAELHDDGVTRNASVTVIGDADCEE